MLNLKKVLLMSASVFVFTTKLYSWNALGHRLVAQIAWHHMTEQAKLQFNHYNHALDRTYKPQSLINAATWLDEQRQGGQQDFSAKHYINLPYSLDGSKLIPPNQDNAVSAIQQAVLDIQAKNKSDFDKGISLRILLHVAADIHQPMHAVSQFSQRLPAGDKGGNLYYLASNPIAGSLHAYWDFGGGFLKTNQGYSQQQLAKKAYRLEKRWPCDVNTMNLDVSTWAAESHGLARWQAYQLKMGEKPDKPYQRMVKQMSQERLALAGCRLAALLNSMVIH